VSVNQQTLLGGARLNSIVDEQYPAPVGPVVDLSWFIMGYHGLSLFIMVYHGLSHYVPCFIITIHSLAVGIAVKKKVVLLVVNVAICIRIIIGVQLYKTMIIGMMIIGMNMNN
jgi:hypothetical protein